MDSELKFLINIVKETSKLITDEFEVTAKDDKGDLVTNFDYEIEKNIIEAIRENKQFKSFDIVSEEFNKDSKLTENCFTIDPIDGTINFANKIPLWGIQVACIKNNETVAAVIYMPKINELYYADQTGAYLNGNKIKVNSLEGKNALYAIAGPGRLETKVKLANISNSRREFGAASVDFAWTACGRISAVNMLGNHAWDYVPGEYIVKQAGGVIYNDEKNHIAANSLSVLENMKI